MCAQTEWSLSWLKLCPLVASLWCHGDQSHSQTAELRRKKIKISGMQWHKEYLSSVNFPSRQERHVEGAHEGNDAREASHGWTTILGELTAVGLAGKRWAGGCQHGVPQEGYDAVKMQTGQWGNYSVRETLQLRSATPPQWCSWNGGLKWSRPLPACIIVYSGYVSWLYSHSP